MKENIFWINFFVYIWFDSLNFYFIRRMNLFLEFLSVQNGE